MRERFDCVIVEGVGGVLVPYDDRGLVIDIAAELALPVLIVARNRLGAVNHTLLTVEAVRNRRMKIIGIVYNSDAGGSDPLIEKDNPRIIEEISGETTLGSLPRLEDNERLYAAFVPIGGKILGRIASGGSDS